MAQPAIVIPLLLLSATNAIAQEPEAAPVPAAATPATGRFFVHLNLGFNVYTHVNATGSGSGPAAANDFTPDKRAIVVQLAGFGYWVHPQIRLTLSLQFVETLSGVDTNKVSPFTSFGIIPWIAWTPGNFFAGAGPFLAPRSYGDWSKLDIGIFTCAGYAFRLGHGLSLSLAVQMPLMFYQRFTFALTPAIALGYRF